jgi:prefoldin subunit 5
MEHIIVNDLVERGEYLMKIRSEMIEELKKLDLRIDQIAEEMRDAGIDVEVEDIWV